MKYIFLILLFTFSIVVFGQEDTKTPKYSNEFLSIGVGARSLGMANSVIATVMMLQEDIGILRQLQKYLMTCKLEQCITSILQELANTIIWVL